MIDTEKNSWIYPLLAIGAALLLLYLSVRRPYLFDTSNLMAALGLVLAGYVGAQYRTHFWTLLLVVFFWAGSSVPLADTMNVFRWVVLGTGALIALAYYGQNANKVQFNHLHLLGLITVIAAFASAMVSVNPLLTTLKALSLAALFIYGSIGVRILWGKDPEPLVTKLSLLTEALVYLTALCYLASFELWGNPNSLGMITGVLCWPVLMWRFVLPGNRREYTRRLFALLVCAVLLVSSLSRASMLAAGLSSTVPLVCTRRYRTLLVGLSLFAAVLLNLYLISPERFTSSADTFLYKKGEKGKILGSRQKPWERSLDTFQEHPWLGLGFGAADNSADWKFDVVTPGQLTRERGSSYLTMLESTGVLGTLPFGLLMLALLRDVRKVFLWLRHTGNPDQPAVVAATVILGCLVNAFFEDWIFAVGYYTSVFFWILALSLRDWMAFPARSQSLSVTERQFDPVTVTRSLVLR